jgi:hypothetical protein
MSVDVAEVAAGQGGKLARIVARFTELVDELVGAKAKGLTLDDLKPLQALIAVDQFKRVGIRREVMNWPEYARYMIAWAGSTGFESRVLRVTETGRLVFLELAERLTRPGQVIEKNTMMVYEFDETDRIREMLVYHQCEE